MHAGESVGVGGWGVVLTGGSAPPRSVVTRFLEGAERIVAADSGLDLALSYAVDPDLVVGDMDSVRRTEELDRFKPEQVIRFSQEKDETDTEIALRTLFEAGIDRTVVVGGGGGRLDHLIAILSIFDREKHPALWVTDTSFVQSIEKSGRLEKCEGKQVSFFPVGDSMCTMESTGLRWSLDGLSWRRGDIGVSNMITESVMTVRMKTGRLILVGALDVISGVVF